MALSLKKILVIRRDNIGDLVCTTPIFRALRQQFPKAYICALVNSYNVAVVARNPDIDDVYVYTKAKHRPKGKTLLGVYWDRLRLILHLRRQHFDYTVLANSRFMLRPLRFARAIRPRHIIGFTEPGARGVRHIDIGLPYTLPHPLHEVEDVFRLLEPLGISGIPPAMYLHPDPSELEEARRKVGKHMGLSSGKLIGIHISTRKDTNRWPVQNFIELIKRLYKSYNATFLLLWAPGDSSNPKHPGDDDKAAAIKHALHDIPVITYPMGPLEQLIADLSLCDTVITSDGGALHIAAALGKPILCFFGDRDATRWYPWGVPYVLLQPPTRNAADISVDDALAGYRKLLVMQEEKRTHPCKTSSGT